MAHLHNFEPAAPRHVTTVGENCYFSLPLSGRNAMRAGLDFVVRTPDGELTFEWVEDPASDHGWVGRPACLLVDEEPAQDAAIVRAYSGIRKLLYMPLSLDELRLVLDQLLIERPLPAGGKRAADGGHGLPCRAPWANSSMLPEMAR